MGSRKISTGSVSARHPSGFLADWRDLFPCCSPLRRSPSPCAQSQVWVGDARLRLAGPQQLRVPLARRDARRGTLATLLARSRLRDAQGCPRATFTLVGFPLSQQPCRVG